MKVSYLYPILALVGLLFFIDLVGIRVGGLNTFYILVPIFLFLFIILILLLNDGKIRIDGISSYYLLLVLFFIYVSIANSSFVSLRYSILVSVWFVIFLILTQVISNIRTKSDAAWNFLKVIHFSLATFILLSLIQHFFFGTFLRLYGFNYGLGPNEMALYCASGVIMSAQLLNKFKKNRYYLFIILFFTSLILTGSRTSTLAIFLLLMWVIVKGLLYFKGKVSGRVFFIMVLVIAGMPFFIYVSGLFILRFYTEISLALQLSDQIVLNPMLTSYRLQGFIVAKEILFDSLTNFFIGTGFENYRVTYKLLLEEYFDGSAMTIHSVYLQILVGGGITTFALFLLYLYKIFEFTLKIKDRVMKNTLLYLLYLNMFYMLLGSTFVNRMVYFVIPSILYIAYKKENKL